MEEGAFGGVGSIELVGLNLVHSRSREVKGTASCPDVCVWLLLVVVVVRRSMRMGVYAGRIPPPPPPLTGR